MTAPGSVMAEGDPKEVGKIVGPVRLPGSYVAAGAMFDSGNVLLYGEAQHVLVRGLKMLLGERVADMPTNWVRLDMSTPFPDGVADHHQLRDRIEEQADYHGTPDDPRSNLWCGGHSFLADGRLMITGGDFAPHAPDDVAEHANFVHLIEVDDDGTVRFEKAPDMKRPRWYPGQVTLPDGRVLVSFGVKNEMEIYDPDTDDWTLATDTTELDDEGLHDDYPWTPVLPDGRVAVVGGWGKETRIWDPETGDLEPGPAQDHHHERHGGSALLLKPARDGEVMVLGGGGHGEAGTDSVERLDPVEDDQETLTSMEDGRHHLGQVLLPTGQVWVTGGGPGRFHEPHLPGWLASVLFDETRNYSYTSELYDPSKDDWTETPKLNDPRPYHHVSLLLPDASVLIAGEEPTMEVYYPPYFFQDEDPPKVTGGDTVVEPAGEPFEIEVEAPDDPIEEVVLMRQGAFTHSYNFGQRAVELDWSGPADGGTVEVTPPPSNAVAPPGHYMLFAITDGGLPSRWAHWVRVEPS